jgi:hypothetical protein
MLHSYQFCTTLKHISYYLVSDFNTYSTLFMSSLPRGLLGHMEFSWIMLARRTTITCNFSNNLHVYRSKPRIFHELEQQIREAFGAVPFNFITKSVESMSSRLQKVVHNADDYLQI